MNSLVYILLPVHNRRIITEIFIKCLVNQTYKNFKLILIDDGSTDGTDLIVQSYIPDVIIIRGDGNWWWGGSLQQGYKYLKQADIKENDIVLIINDDVEFSNDYLDSILKETKSGNLILSRAFSKQTGKLIDKGICVNWKKLTFDKAENSKQVNCLSTRGLFLHATTFLKVKGFYPFLLPHYLSDYEFTIRAKRLGFELSIGENVELTMNEETTGHHFSNQKNISSFLKVIFSKRSAINPVYFTNFILLASPSRYLIINILRIWKNFLLQLFKYMK